MFVVILKLMHIPVLYICATFNEDVAVADEVILIFKVHCNAC